MMIKKLMDAIKKILQNPNLINELTAEKNEQRKEIENVRNENNCLESEIKEWKRQSNQIHEQVECMVNNVLGDNSKLEVEEIYDSLKFIDPEGWCIYGASKEILGINIYREFIVEDTMGRFEESDGHELKTYMEIAAFGDCTYKIISNCYEILDKYTIDYDSKEYKKYLNELYPLAVSRLIKKLSKEEPVVKLQYVQRHMEDSSQEIKGSEIELDALVALVAYEVKEVQEGLDDEEMEM